MNNFIKYKEDLDQLISTGNDLYMKLILEKKPEDIEDFVKNNPDKIKALNKRIPSFSSKYQQWYSEAYELVKQLLPSRLADFEEYYKGKGSRKEITYATYTIKDALAGLQVTRGWEKGVVVDSSAAIQPVFQQVQIIDAISNKFKSSLFDIKNLVHAEFLDGELSEASVLLKNGYFRAAGALSGVALESHLKSVCVVHAISLKNNPSLSDYNDGLKDAVYDTAEWRRIQHLTDLRNKCDHKKTDEPTKENIEDLINGTERIIKNIF